jgi:hypothetical protein
MNVADKIRGLKGWSGSVTMQTAIDTVATEVQAHVAELERDLAEERTNNEVADLTRTQFEIELAAERQKSARLAALEQVVRRSLAVDVGESVYLTPLSDIIEQIAVAANELEREAAFEHELRAAELADQLPYNGPRKFT